MVLKEQRDLSKELEVLEKNYRKDGAARKTTQYLQKKREALESLMSTFRANHRKLLGLLKADNPYLGLQEEMAAKVGAIRTIMESDQFQSQCKPTTEDVGA